MGFQYFSQNCKCLVGIFCLIYCVLLPTILIFYLAEVLSGLMNACSTVNIAVYIRQRSKNTIL